MLNAPDNYSDIIFSIDTKTSKNIVNGSGHMNIKLKEGSTINTFSLNFATTLNGYDDKQTPLPLKLGWMLGFRNGYYKNKTNYRSENIVNLQSHKYIYLVVDDFNNSVNDGFYGAFTSSILNKNILARISLQGSVFNGSLNLVTSPRQYFGPVDIQNIQIQLLDEYGTILNLNNMDYSFCLTFQTIYDL